MIISPSIASANPLKLEEELRKINHTEFQDLHIDIEDGNFIPNITFGLKTIKALRKITNLPFSFHLMVKRPQDYVEDLVRLKPSIIFAHVEAIDYPLSFLEIVQKHGVKCGLAFNPKTPVDPYLYVLQHADGVLIMTSEPDGKGQEFIPLMVEKAKTIKAYGLPIEIWVDGGVKREYLDLLKNAGVTHTVMGREIFGQY